MTAPAGGGVTGSATTALPPVSSAYRAVIAVFVANGFVFASWFSRIPGVREHLELTNSGLGLLLLSLAAGSVLSLPTTGALIHRFGTVPVLRTAVVLACLGLLAVSFSLIGDAHVAPVAIGLFCYGVGIGVWDVSMNVEGAEVERQLGRTVMPGLHAAFSLGTVAGAGVGALVVWLGLAPAVHLIPIVVAAGALVWLCTRSFLPDEPDAESGPTPSGAWRAWTEPRTLVIGVMVLALALTEGTANDWLAAALVDGYDVEHWVGVAGFATFVTAMTLGRLAGGRLLDRFGRVPVLWGTMAVAFTGVLLIVYGQVAPVIVVGILMWGVGASLGFPVGMSAAADDPVGAAARVSVVSTIGYAAFLAGPPLLGFVGDRVGTLHALLVVSVMLVPAALAVPAARPRSTART